MHNTTKSIFLTLLLLGQGFSLFGSDTLSLDLFLSDHQIKAEKMLNGVFYTLNILEERKPDKVGKGLGDVPRQGNFIKIAYSGKLLSGRIFDESPKDEPFVFQLGSKQVIEGLESALQRLKIGTKATLYIPPHLAFGTDGLGDIIPPNAPVIYEVELLEIMTAEQYAAYVHRLEDQERIAFDSRMTHQLETEQRHINDYALLHRLKVKRTKSGLNYIVTKAGDGENAQAGSTVSLYYEALFLSDIVFDETKADKPLTFTLGQKQADSAIIAGLEEGLTFFNERAEGYIFIPSKLGYSGTPIEDNGRTIPAYSVLIYKIQVVAIKAKDEDARENK